MPASLRTSRSASRASSTSSAAFRRSLCSCSAMRRGRCAMPSPASSRWVTRVSSDATTDACPSASRSRAEASPRLPMGVAARMIMPQVSRTRERVARARPVVAITLGAWVLRPTPPTRGHRGPERHPTRATTNARGNERRRERRERRTRGAGPTAPAPRVRRARPGIPRHRARPVVGRRALHPAAAAALVLGRTHPRDAARGRAALLEPRASAGARVRRDVLRQGRVDAAAQRLRVGLARGRRRRLRGGRHRHLPRRARLRRAPAARQVDDRARHGRVRRRQRVLVARDHGARRHRGGVPARARRPPALAVDDRGRDRGVPPRGRRQRDRDVAGRPARQLGHAVRAARVLVRAPRPRPGRPRARTTARARPAAPASTPTTARPSGPGRG